MGLGKVWRQVRGGERTHNVIAVSDLHLGIDLKAGGARMAPGAAQLDRSLSKFLEHYTAHREGDKPWKLLLNGDIIDFVAITVTPPAGDAAAFQISAEERTFGLAPEEQKCIWKLRKVFERHAEVVDALARFVLAGNSVSLIRGNHDAELRFPGVKAEFTRLLAERAGVPAGWRRRFDRQVEFHDWFYLEPGYLYAEHGNAHDRYCMPEDFLAEVSPAQTAGRELALPMSSQVMRYFANKYVAQCDLDDADTWGFKEYVQWVVKMGNPLQIAADYFVMVWRLLYPVARQSLRLGKAAARVAGRAIGQSRDEALRHVSQQLSRFGRTGPAQAQRLLEVASHPAEQSLFDSMQLFYLDRMLLALVSLCTAVGVVVTAQGWLSKLLCGGAVGVLFAALNALLGRRRQTDAHPMLQQGARRVAQIFDVKFIVMGHSHRMVSEQVGARTRYFNLGSWTVPPPHKPFEGFPHLVVSSGKAEMRRWGGPAAQPKVEEELAPMFPATA